LYRIFPGAIISRVTVYKALAISNHILMIILNLPEQVPLLYNWLQRDRETEFNREQQPCDEYLVNSVWINGWN